MRKSLAEVAVVRELTLITAVRMSKERRLSLKKVNPVEVLVIHVVVVEVFFRGRGKTDGAPRGGGHQMSFCKTEVNKESQDGFENINQSKTDRSLNSDSKDKEGVCYFLKSRLLRVRLTVGKLKFFVTQGVHIVLLNVAWFLMIC